MLKWLAPLLLFVIPAVSSIHAEENAKYVFLFIGDGMGVNQRMLAETALRSEHPGARLTINSLPANGLTGTNNLEGKTTDSAASGTAIACGAKTSNGIIGLTPAPDNSPLVSIAKLAKKHGMRVGVISSDSLNGATPASFYANCISRKRYPEIALQMATSGVDFFGGSEPLVDKTIRNEFDAEMKKAGYKTVSGKDGLQKLTSGKAIATNRMAYVIDREKRKNSPTLAEYTAKAIQLLKNPQGFFLMVEGGEIDHAGHANDSGALIQEVYDFDRAVNVAMEFYRKHPTQTLIVVTADHETGGLLFNCSYQMKPLLKQQTSYSTTVKRLQALKSPKDTLNDALKIIMDAYGINSFAETNQKILAPLWADKNCKAFSAAGLKIRDAGCGIKWSSTTHTPQKIKTSAIGCGSEMFNGDYENSDIFSKLKTAIGLMKCEK